MPSQSRPPYLSYSPLLLFHLRFVAPYPHCPYLPPVEVYHTHGDFSAGAGQGNHTKKGAANSPRHTAPSARFPLPIGSGVFLYVVMLWARRVLEYLKRDVSHFTRIIRLAARTNKTHTFVFPKILCLFEETKNTGLPEGKVPMFCIPDPALHKRGCFFACTNPRKSLIQ